MPKLPNVENAQIEPRKITHYVLSNTHPLGRAKARFLQRFGYRPGRPRDLRDALLEHAHAYEATVLQSPPHGTKFEVRGRLTSPDGRNPRVKVIWFVAEGEKRPRFVTLVPD